jgi:hypothetical protein
VEALDGLEPTARFDAVHASHLHVHEDDLNRRCILGGEKP